MNVKGFIVAHILIHKCPLCVEIRCACIGRRCVEESNGAGSKNEGRSRKLLQKSLTANSSVILQSSYFLHTVQNHSAKIISTLQIIIYLNYSAYSFTLISH